MKNFILFLLLFSLSFCYSQNSVFDVYDKPVWNTVLSLQVNNSIDNIGGDLTAYWDYGFIAPSFSIYGGTDGVFFRMRPLHIRVFQQGKLSLYINPFYLNLKMDGLGPKDWKKNTPSGIVIHFMDKVSSELQIDWYTDGPVIQYRAGWLICKK